MKNKLIALVLIGVLAIGSFSFIMYKKHKAENTPNIRVTKIENKKDEVKKSENKEEVKQDDYYGLPEGFVTSIKNKAKRVVENFIQALLSFNRENPTEYSNIAMQYMDEPLKENFKHELEDIKKTAGLNPYNLSKPIKVYSSEKLNTLKSDYLEFKTRVKLENYDKRNQPIGNNMTPDYRVKLLPINGEWKIIEYQMD